MDETDNRYGDVELHVCRQCGTHWLRYFVEHEAFSRSGRWYYGLLPDALSACDKLSNLQAILLDLTETGDGVWSRFTGKMDGSLWYYGSLIEAFSGRIPAPIELALRRDFQRVVEAG